MNVGNSVIASQWNESQKIGQGGESPCHHARPHPPPTWAKEVERVKGKLLGDGAGASLPGCMPKNTGQN